MSSFENNTHRISYKRLFIPTVETNNYDVMIGGKILFDQSVKNDTKPYENIRKISIGQRDNYATGCLLDYLYFKKNYKLISVALSKQQALDVNINAIQDITNVIQMQYEVW